MQKENNQNYCTLYLVRHGETEWNVKRIIQGHLDSPLTEKGVKQVEDTAQELKHISFDAIFSSDLPRAFRTAEIIKLERELVVQTSELLRERNHGKYEGVNVDKYREILKDKLEEANKLSEEKRRSFKISAEIESDEELTTRFITKLREIALAFSNKTVLVVSHGVSLRTFLVKIGYAKNSQLLPGAFSNAGYVKVASDGIDFIIKEVKGVKKTEETK